MEMRWGKGEGERKRRREEGIFHMHNHLKASGTFNQKADHQDFFLMCWISREKKLWKRFDA